MKMYVIICINQLKGELYMTKKIIKMVSETIADVNKDAVTKGNKKLGAKLLQAVYGNAAEYYTEEKDKTVLWNIVMLIDSDGLEFTTNTKTDAEFYNKLKTSIKNCKASSKEDEEFINNIIKSLDEINMSLNAGVDKVQQVVHDIEMTTMDFVTNDFSNKSAESTKIKKQLIQMYIADMARLLTELKEGYDEL